MINMRPSDVILTDQDGTQPVIELLKKNYQCLHRQYRLGGFERCVGYVGTWVAGQYEPKEFYELGGSQLADPQNSGNGRLSFQKAIDDLYQLTALIERNHQALALQNAVLLLRCKCLVYEAKDYLLNVPPALGVYFSELAAEFPESASEIEAKAQKLNGGPFVSRGDRTEKDERARVIKIQLIAALCGANELFRRHNTRDYDHALFILGRLTRIITVELPKQHETERESFGLLALAQYLTAKVLSGKGSFAKAREAFHLSAEAYFNRLRQKEQFYRDGLITNQDYEEKVSVTLRRLALVTAFGDGYLSLVGSEITKALGSFTLARAALTRNSGQIYLNYVDVLYWTCQRARYSSEPGMIDTVVQELTKCRESFEELLENPHYKHRTGLQLAVAHYYRGKGSEFRDDEDYDKGMSYLMEAIRDSEARVANHIANPPLLAEALTIQARFLSSRYRRDKDGDPELAYGYLNEAKAVAERACLVSSELQVIEAEAWVALGDVYTDLTELHQRRSSSGQAAFRSDFDNAMRAFKTALDLNDSQNRRIEGLCRLRLTKLCLLEPSSELSAREHFEQWRKIEGEVEHEYCKEMARDLEKRLREPLLLVKAWECSELEYWTNRVSDFLLDEALKQFVDRWGSKIRDNRALYADKRLKSLLARTLAEKLDQDLRVMIKTIDDENLMDRVKMMIDFPLSPGARKKFTSFLNKKLKEAVREFVDDHPLTMGKSQPILTDQELRERLAAHLRAKLHYTPKKVEGLIKRDGLIERVVMMRKQAAKGKADEESRKV